MRIVQPIYFRKRGSGSASKARQRAIVARKEELHKDTNPQMMVWRRHEADGTRVSVATVSRVGEGVLPIRLVRVSKDTTALQVGETLFYMDSGFADVGDFNLNPVSVYVIEPSTLYQNSRLLALYAMTVNGNLLHGLRPLLSEAVDNDFPPSFNYTSLPASELEVQLLWHKTRWHMNGGTLAGNCSGKLKLKEQALRGRRLPAYATGEYASCSPVSSISGTGLFTESDGVYWRVVLDNVAGTATFARLVIPSALTGLFELALSTDEHLMLEAFCLAYSITSSVDVVTVDITGSSQPEDATPFAYGPKFNWGGSEATQVVHRPTGSGINGNPVTAGICNQMSMETKVVTFSLSKIGDTFNVSRSVGSAYEWMFQDGLDLIWYPNSIGGMCQVVAECSHGILKTQDTPTDVPFSCYYGNSGSGYENNDLVFDTQTREYDPSHYEDYTPCPTSSQGAVFHCKDEFRARDNWSKLGYLNTTKAKINGTTVAMAEISQSMFILKTISYSANVTWTSVCGGLGNAIDLVACNPDHADGPCFLDSVGRLETNGIGMAGFTHTLKGTVSFASESGYVNLSGGVAHVYPPDGAEAIIIAERFFSSGNLTITDGVLGNANAIWCTKYGLIWDDATTTIVDPPCSGLDPGGWELIGDFYGVTGNQFAIHSGTGSSSVEAVQNSEGSILYYGRHYKDPLEEEFDVSKRNGESITVADDPSIYWVTFDKDEPCIGAAPELIQGIGPEMAGLAGVDRQLTTGFPTELEDSERKAGIIGAT